METCLTLIHKLYTDSTNQATAQQLLTTVYQLQKELHQMVQPISHYKKTGKVSVLMPNSFQPNIFEPNFEPTVVFDTIATTTLPEILCESNPLASPEPKKNTPDITTLINENTEVEHPTLVMSDSAPDKKMLTPITINETVQPAATKDLNDTYQTKSGYAVAELIEETPLKDLRKGIGVNDKFLFISELFRGDEVMYERSIKTINNYGIYPEAQYWMEREFKIKLGWNMNNDVVQHFYGLVKRRFATM